MVSAFAGAPAGTTAEIPVHCGGEEEYFLFSMMNDLDACGFQSAVCEYG